MNSIPTSTPVTAAIVAILSTVMSSQAANENPWSLIPVPEEEHGYNSFESQVISTKEGLDAFLQALADNPDGWNNPQGFVTALTEAGIDFGRQSLVLVRITEGSASTRIEPRVPTLDGTTLTLVIDREEPGGFGLTVMAYYCFALVVDKAAVGKVEVKTGDAEAQVLHIPSDPD